jgi:hypothetical protein
MARKTDILEANDVTNYPTWSWWGTTNVIVKNIGTAECVVTFNAGAGHESHNLDPNERRQYGRQWAGFRLYVKNEGDQDGEHRLEVTVY